MLAKTAKFIPYRRENGGAKITAYRKPHIPQDNQKITLLRRHYMAKYRILLADSNNQFQTTVRDYLTAQEGIERVDTVNDGQSALDAMNNNRYDVLLCDLIMPGMDGFELLERLNSGLVKDVPAVIVISALRQEEMVRQACTLGAKYYMVKPIDPDTLYKRIMDMMESTYAQRSQVCAISPKPQTLDEKIASVLSYKEHQIPLLIMQLHNSTALYQKQTIRIMKDLPSGGRSFLFYLFFNLLIKFKISSTSSSLSSFKPQTAFCINSGFLNPSSKNSSGVIPK